MAVVTHISIVRCLVLLITDSLGFAASSLNCLVVGAEQLPVDLIKNRLMLKFTHTSFCAVRVKHLGCKWTAFHNGARTTHLNMRNIASSHHGGYVWMMSLGAGISWAAVSLLNNTSTRALSWEAACPSAGSWWSSQCTSCMPHSSCTSSTSSTSTPGLSTGEQSNNNTDVMRVHTVHSVFTHSDSCSLRVLRDEFTI